jgi:hypothetical protein
MRKIKLFLLFFALLFCLVSKAQQLYIKPYAQYHQAISSQNEPAFFQRFGTDVEDFTLSEGLKYGLTIGYTFKNSLGIEFSTDYFNTHKIFEKTENTYWYTEPSGSTPVVVSHIKTTDWQYRTSTFRPLFTYTVGNKNSMFTGKIGPFIGFAEMTFNQFTFDTKRNWGYSAGIEYDYHFSNRYSLALEFGIEQYKYTPKRATGYEEGMENEIIINYVDKTNHKINDWYIDSPYDTTGSIPPVIADRFKESILFNSFYFGIGIKYNIYKK